MICRLFAPDQSPQLLQALAVVPGFGQEHFCAPRAEGGDFGAGVGIDAGDGLTADPQGGVEQRDGILTFKTMRQSQGLRSLGREQQRRKPKRAIPFQ